MSSEASGPNPAKGLPPVVPPSGRFIAQLFLVPGLIVAGAVIVLLGLSWLAGGSRSPKAFIGDLKSTNSDIRWRTASDLAQVLKRDPALAANPEFGLELASLLRQAMTDLERAEADRAKRSGGTQTKEALAQERKETFGQRSYIQYLAASLGNLATPVGGPILAELAAKSPSRDPEIEALLRRQAVWALASLGDRLQRAAQLPDGQRSALLDYLEHAAGTSEQTEWARRSAAWLRGQEPLGVVDGLAACAEADDPFLRKLTAHALGFWDGTPAEDRRIDALLLTLTRDDGHGTMIEIKEDTVIDFKKGK